MREWVKGAALGFCLGPAVGAGMGAIAAILITMGSLLTGSQGQRPVSNPLSYVVGMVIICGFGAVAGLFVGLLTGPVIGAAAALFAQRPLPRALVGLTIGAVPGLMMAATTRVTMTPDGQIFLGLTGTAIGAVGGLLTATLTASILKTGAERGLTDVAAREGEAQDNTRCGGGPG